MRHSGRRLITNKWALLLRASALLGLAQGATGQTVGTDSPIIPPPITIPKPKSEEVGGEVTTLDAFKVDGAPVKNSVVSERKNANVSVDVLTSADYTRFAPTDIADVVIRMPGLSTTTRGSFVVVRGLAERYNPIMMDGIVVPSSDPERQTPELDLFPARLVDAVVVNKVFEPHLPATSSGGAVDLRSKPLPEGRYAQVQFGIKADTGAIKSEGFFHSGVSGTWNLFALGANDRPAGPAESEWIARTTNKSTTWKGQSRSFPIGARASAVFEDRIDLGADGRAFGYSLSFGYDSSASSEEGRVLGFYSDIRPGSDRLTLADGSLAAAVAGEDYAEYEREVRLGGLVNLGLAFNPNHSIGASLFISQVGIENVTRTFNGFKGLSNSTADQLALLYQSFETGKVDPKFNGLQENDGNLLLSESVYYRQRNLTNMKVSGDHRFEGVRAAKVSWSLARIKAGQEDPDFSYLGYSQYFAPIPGVSPYYILYGQPVRLPSRYWREVTEKSWAGRVDGELKFDVGSMEDVVGKLGLYRDETKRDFRQNSFYLSGGPSSDANSLDELVSELQNASFGVGGRGFGTNPAFATANRILSAAYAGFGLPILKDKVLFKKLDLAIGARIESYRFTAAGRGQLGNAGSADYYIQQSVTQKIGASIVGSPSENLYDKVYTREIDENTIHPSAALTWSPMNRLNVRMSYSRTVARPSFREMGPYFTNDEVTNESQHGNVFLNSSKVKNLDFRIEYFFPKSRDLVALSVFSKDIENPIEKSADYITGSDLTVLGWFNNPSPAKLRGIEFEVSKGLGFLGEIGSWFTVGGNGTFIDAKVGVSPGESAPPGTERNLFDQPEWIANVYVSVDRKDWGFSSTLSGFAISDVLRSTAVGRWNTFVASHQRIDLTLSQRISSQWLIRLSAKNLTDPERKFIADPELTSEAIVLRRFKDGRDYSITAAYDF